MKYVAMAAFLVVFLLALAAFPAARAVLWADPAGNAQGWYNIPNDFSFWNGTSGLPDGNLHPSTGEWVNETGVSSPGGYALFADSSGAFEPVGYTEMWRGGFTKGVYSLRPTVYSSDNNNFTIAVKNSSEIWINYTVGCTQVAESFYCNVTSDSVQRYDGFGGGDGVGIPAYVNTSGMLHIKIWANATGTNNRTRFNALNITALRSHEIISSYTEPTALETKNSIYNISILDNIGTDIITGNANLFINGTLMDGVTAIRSGNYSNFTFIGPPPNMPDELNGTSYDVTWQIFINGTLIQSIANVSSTQFVERLRLLRCAAPMGNHTMTFTVLDEDDSHKINTTDFDVATTAIYVDSGSRNYSFKTGSDYQFEFCIFPGWAQYIMNTTVKYTNGSYDDRWYWEEGKHMSNITTNITLYMFDGTASVIPAFSVLNLFQSPQSNVIVQAWRWFVGENIYKRVVDGKTSNEGVVDLPLKPNEQYIYRLYRGGDLLVSWGPDLLSSTTTSKELYTESGSFSNLWNYYGKISATCSNTSTVLTCQYSDDSGLAVLVGLEVSAFIDSLNNTQSVCMQNSTISSGTLSCNFVGYENKTIQYSVFVRLVDGTELLLVNDFVQMAAPLLELGVMGVFASFIIILTFSLIGLSRPEIGISGPIIMGYIGMVISWWFGLLVVPVGIMAGFGFAVAVVTFIIITRGNS